MKKLVFSVCVFLNLLQNLKKNQYNIVHKYVFHHTIVHLLIAHTSAVTFIVIADVPAIHSRTIIKPDGETLYLCIRVVQSFFDTAYFFPPETDFEYVP